MVIRVETSLIRLSPLQCSVIDAVAPDARIFTGRRALATLVTRVVPRPASRPTTLNHPRTFSSQTTEPRTPVYAAINGARIGAT